MLLLVSWFYILSNFPREFNHQFWPRHLDFEKSVPDLRSLSLELQVFIEASNYAINFYLYVAACSKFRMTLRKKFMRHGEKKSRMTVVSVEETG